MNFHILALLVIHHFIRFSRSDVSCADGFVTNGHSCDECGVNEFVIREGPINSTWAASVIIYQSYKTLYVFPDNTSRFVDQRIHSFSGTLINKYTVLISAQSIIRNFSIFHNSQSYQIFIEKNEYHSTWGSMFTVYLYGLKVEMGNDAVLTTPYTVETLKRHLLYNETTGMNNIAILMLKDGVDFDLHHLIRPACLPSQSQIYPPTNTTLDFYSYFDFDPPLYTFTDQFVISVNDSTFCNFTENDSNGKLCTNISPAYCGSGSMGGGLYKIENLNGVNKFVVSSVVPDNFNLCTTNFTRVSNYIDWIRTNWKIVC